MTYDPSVVDIEEDLLPVGWARHVTEGFFESVTVIPKDDHDDSFFHQDRDEPWFIAQRTVDSAVKRYVEYMPPDNYQDSMIEYSGVSTAVLAGLDHLEGLEVQIKADGAAHPPRTVQNGSITLDYPVTSAQVGLKYTSYMKTSKWEEGSPSGTGQTATIRWSEIVARLDKSAIPLINDQQPAIRHPITPMGLVEPLITGDISVRNLGLDKEGSVIIQTDKPFACHLLAIFGQMGIHAG